VLSNSANEAVFYAGTAASVRPHCRYVSTRNDFGLIRCNIESSRTGTIR
jgi:hypothetical protein